MSTYFNKAKSRWVFEFDKVINGRRVRAVKALPEGWNRTKAEAFSKAEEDKLYSVATGVTKERALIEMAVELYINHQCPKLKNGDGAKMELARIYWAYEGRYLDELAEVAREYTAKVENELSPASIKNKLSYLRAACRYAQKNHSLGDGENLSVSMPIVRNERHHYVTRAEMLRIARACKDRHARALVRLAFYSGMRLGEMMSIGDTGRVLEDAFLLTETKNGSQRVVPMHPRVRVLRKYLPMKYSKIWMQRLCRKAMDAAGFKHLHFHDLRHSTASELINKGVDLFTVGKILGHKDNKSTARYSHLATETIAAAIRKIG